ncbi:MAG: hypothetical protein CSA42_01365 [Gammaproteobacteria bacterium]|nr:MAG: hypothetical protein CSA42_01365 [Gammaproteobacteria bacterium]
MKTLNLKIPPVVIGAITALLIWGSARLLSQSSWDFSIRLTLCLCFFVIGAVIALSGVVQFRKTKTTVNPTAPHHASALVSDGIYNYTRNPMYLGLALVLAAIVFFFGKMILLFWVLCFVLYMTQFQIKPEEEVLQQKFGNTFEAYKKSVRRWV